MRSLLVWAALSRRPPWRIAAVNAADSFLQCAGPSGRGTRRPGLRECSLLPCGPEPGWKHRSRQSCFPLPLPFSREARTLPCPGLHVDTSPGLFGVHGRWPRLQGGDLVSSQSTWMMLLKHNNDLVCVL